MSCPTCSECGEPFDHSHTYAGCLLQQRDAEREARQQDAEWHDDERDEWSPQIEAAFPTRSGSHDAYATAQKMVRNRRSKGALLALVNWLLVDRDAANARAEKAEAADEERWQYERAERDELTAERDAANARAEAAEAVNMHGCDCSQDDACLFVRERDAANARAKRLREALERIASLAGEETSGFADAVEAVASAALAEMEKPR